MNEEEPCKWRLKRSRAEGSKEGKDISKTEEERGE